VSEIKHLVIVLHDLLGEKAAGNGKKKDDGEGKAPGP
jgi:hypothetical protein